MGITLLVLACVAAAIAAWIYTTQRTADRQYKYAELELATKKHTLEVYCAETRRMVVEHMTGNKHPHRSPGDTTPDQV